GVVGQVDEQLLQRSVLLGQRVARCQVVTAVAVREVHLRIVLRGVVKLVRAIELISTADKSSGEPPQRHEPLILRPNNVVKGSAVRDQVDVFLVRLPGYSAAIQ